jgi:hypothetical protein
VGDEDRNWGLVARREGGMHANRNLEGMIKHDEISLIPPYYLSLSFLITFFSSTISCLVFIR